MTIRHLNRSQSLLLCHLGHKAEYLPKSLGYKILVLVMETHDEAPGAKWPCSPPYTAKSTLFELLYQPEMYGGNKL